MQGHPTLARCLRCVTVVCLLVFRLGCCPLGFPSNHHGVCSLGCCILFHRWNVHGVCVGGNEQINSSLTAVDLGTNYNLSGQGLTILRQAMQVLQSPSPCVMLCGVDGVIVWMCVCVSVSHVWQGECLGVILFPCAWMVESACCCACPTINVCVTPMLCRCHSLHRHTDSCSLAGYTTVLFHLCLPISI